MERFTDDDARWQAVLTRSRGADGYFYYAVRTTGIYCRPSCPSRRPQRGNVVFFADNLAAEQAGFRPCLRCKPDQVAVWQRTVAQVEQLLQTADRTPTLAEIGQAVGLSPFHLQRVFKRATGLSPKEYAAVQRSQRLKAELKQGTTVTDALYDAGYGSARSLYATAHKQLGMTPGAYRQGGLGESIRYGFANTPVGLMLIAATAKGICALRFGEQAELEAELQAEFPRAGVILDPEAVETYLHSILAYLAGEPAGLNLPLDMAATPFQRRVWSALRAIPYGQTRSYAEIAAMIGQATAVRAVARACASNPVALVVPCHRVVRSDGDLSGYRWGAERKRVLLGREGVKLRPPS